MEKKAILTDEDKIIDRKYALNRANLEGGIHGDGHGSRSTYRHHYWYIALRFQSIEDCIGF